MTEDLPSFDPDHETPTPKERPPKKPRRKPAKKKRALRKPPAVPVPKKKRRVPYIDRRTKAFRQAKVGRKIKPKSSYQTAFAVRKARGEVGKLKGRSVELPAIGHLAAFPRESMTKFIEHVLGIKMQPWQARVLNAVLEEKK